MAALTIKHDGYYFFNEAAQASSEVVGYENSHQRGIRYKFTIPTSRTAGATSYSFTKTSNGHGGGTSGLRWNYALSTDASAYLDTCAAGDGYASAAATFSGSKTGLKLLPGTVYYLFIYPGEEKLGWYYWNYPDSKMTFSVDGDITYSVSYNANGGSGAPGNQTKTHGTSLTLSSTKPTKSSTSATGYKVTFDTQGGSSVSAITSSKTTTYTFSKWNTNSGGTGTSYNAGASYTANAAVTLYAQYTSSTSNGSITLPSAPTKSGYSFSGWYDAASGGNKIGNAGASYTPTKAITLYAQWSATGYSITYTLNGGTVSGNPTSYTADTATFTLKNPTKEGYDFTGWTGSNGTTAQTSVSIAKGSTGNKSYTANWTPKTYTISYTLNSGTVSGNPTSYTIETATFTLKNPTRTNYTFTGWTGSNGTNPETTVTIAKGSTGNKSYTANWSQNVISYTISYNYDGGVKGTYAPTSANVDAYVQISNPTRSGYTFKGWSISGMNPSSTKKCYYGSSTTDSSNQSTTSTSLSSITATQFKNLRTSAGTVTFKATWEAIPTTVTYTISYDYASGNKGTYAPASGTVGEYVRISNPTKSNATFKGWTISGINPSYTNPCYHGSTQTDSSNTRVTSGTSLSGITSEYYKNLRNTSGTVTFTATWESTPTTTSYSITYNYNGGQKGTYAPSTADVGSYVQISNPTRSGYTFKGWSISGLSVSYSSPAYHGTTQTDSSNTRVTSGTTLSGITSTYFKNLRNSSGTVTFTATWEAVQTEDTEYNISYSLGTGATAGSPAPTSGTKGTYINIGNPSRTNYTFTGWNITGLDSGTHYHGNSKPTWGNYGATSVTGTSISGVKSTWFSLQATGTVIFTATWESSGSSGEDTTISYSITYDYDDGVKGTYAPSSANVGEYVQISNPTKSDHTFKGWTITNMNPTSTNKCYYGNYATDTGNQSTTATSLSGITATQFKNLRTSAGTVTFTAVWESNASQDQELTGLILRPVSDTTLGHSCSSGTSGYSMISETTADDDTTYIYQQVTATTDQTATSTFKLSATMPSGEFKITGATIKVRSKTDSNGTYSGTYQLSTDTSTSDITLNATAYESTFNSNVCSNLIGNTYTSATFPEISVTITTTGKTTSTGSKSSGQTAEIHITQVYLQLEYEAVIDNTYDIVYTLNGGNKGNPAPSSGTKGTYVNIANPTRSGYTFTGWNITGLDSGTHHHGNSKPTFGDYGATSATGTSINGVKSTWFSLQATGTVTFTATWELTPTIISYTIQYNYDGGVKGTYAPTSADVDAYVQISNPSKSGFTFKGWNITGMNPTSSKRCYYGSSTTDSSNQSTTSTSLSGITATRFKNLRTSAGTVTFTATWEDNTPEEELTGLILRPIADTTLGHTCSSGTAGYSMISETTADDDTTYIYQQVTEQTAQSATSTFKLGGTLPSGAFKITGATIRVRGKSDSNGTYSGTYQLSTDSAASNITLSATAYSNTTNSDVCNSLIGNIYTSSTLPDISVTITTTGQITSTGTKTGGQTTPEIRITQVYLQLEYEPVLGLAKVYTQNAWHNALSYIFINGTWKIVQAHARKNSNWKPGQGS